MQPVGALIETLLRFGHTDTIILCLSKINVKIWILDPLAFSEDKKTHIPSF